MTSERNKELGQHMAMATDSNYSLFFAECTGTQELLAWSCQLLSSCSDLAFVFGYARNQGKHLARDSSNMQLPTK